jgi:predicted ATP-dependent endonuclease of OLD family
MKILRLAAENFKRLRAIEITPDGNIVRITGKNGAGKSSALDAIWAALAGEKAAPPMPIRKGEASAEVNIDLGEFMVRRRWTASGSTIEVSAGSAAFKSPQKMLDQLIGTLSFDPLAFAGKKAAEQRADLLALLGIGDKLAMIEAERKKAFEDRTLINRDTKNLEGQLAGTPAVDAPAEEISITAAMDELKAARAVVAQRDVKLDAVRQAKQKADQMREREKALDERAKEFQRQAEAMAKELIAISVQEDQCEQQAKKLQLEADAIVIPDVAAIEAKIAGADATNQKVRQLKARQDLQRKLEATKKSADALTDAVAAAEKKKTDLVAASPLPVSNLGFSEAGVTFKGVPLEQCAASERLKVSVAVAMAINPRIRVILIRDASLLDSGNLKMLEELAKARDFQLWLEEVDESGKVGVYIEDGAVATVDGVPTAPRTAEAKTA